MAGVEKANLYSNNQSKHQNEEASVLSIDWTRGSPE